jgi:hypothetical protein
MGDASGKRHVREEVLEAQFPDSAKRATRLENAMSEKWCLGGTICRTRGVQLDLDAFFPTRDLWPECHGLWPDLGRSRRNPPKLAGQSGKKCFKQHFPDSR